MPSMAPWIGDKLSEPLPCCGQSCIDLLKSRTMTGDDQVGLQALDQIERFRDFIEGLRAFNFRKNNAEAVFPKCISGNKKAQFRLEEDDRVRVMPRCCVYFPISLTQAQRRTWLQNRIKAKWRARLSSGAIAKSVGIPAPHLLRMAGGDQRT